MRGARRDEALSKAGLLVIPCRVLLPPAAQRLCLPSHHPLQVPISRLASLNKPELPAAFFGLLGSAALGMMMPGFAIAFSSILAVFYGPGGWPEQPMPWPGLPCLLPPPPLLRLCSVFASGAADAADNEENSMRG